MTERIDDPDQTLPSGGEATGVGRGDFVLQRGASVGRYTVLGRVGSGGMGVVFAAYDPELDRKVAIKLLSPHADHEGSEGRTRLLREAQAMAKLSHPNIVSVHDVGTTGGHVWVAMEFIEGETLSEWGKAGRSWREVVDVMQRAGQGLAAAHAAGLVYRDFKPENVMIRADGRVCVMDFGLARSVKHARVESEPPSETDTAASSSGATHLNAWLTQAGAIVGTPAYMAPEQLRGDAVDVRTDVFAFCVTFWELLYGTRPFGGDSLADLAASVLAGNRTKPTSVRLPTWVRRVLDRGLEIDPDARWPSMEELLSAVKRGRGRRRTQRILAIAIVAAAVGGGAATARELGRRAAVAACESEGASVHELWPGRAATLEQALEDADFPHTETTLAKLAPWLDEWTEHWASVRTAMCLESTVDGVLEPDVYRRATTCLELQRGRVEALVNYLETGDRQLSLRVVGAASDLEPPESCADRAHLDAMPWPNDDAWEAVFAVQRRLYRLDSMELAANYEQGLDLAAKVEAEATALEWAPLVAQARARRASLLERTNRFEEAERAFRESYFDSLRAGADGLAADMAIQLVWVIGVDQARHTAAIEWADHASALMGRLGVPEGHREALLASHLAAVHYGAGDYDAAAEQSTRALEVWTDVVGPDHPNVAHSLHALANVAAARGDEVDSDRLDRRALAIWESAYGTNHPTLGSALNGISIIAKNRGEYDEAERLQRRALRIYEETYGEENQSVAMSLNNLSNIYKARGSFAEAERLQERALVIKEKTLGPDHPDLAYSLENLGVLHRKRGDLDGAAELHRRAISIRERALGLDHPEVADPLTSLAVVHLERGETTEALALLERAVAIHEKRKTPEDRRAETRIALARALWDAPPGHGRDRERARDLAMLAEKSFARLGPVAAEEREAVSAWLAARR